MNSFYKNTLYPLQDKILKIIGDLKTPFYLTGGTVLSRCFFQHRYSEDLDFFVHRNPRFAKLAELIYQTLLKRCQATIDIKSDSFYSLKVEKTLKIDFVNDVAVHFGEIKKHEIFPRIDNVKNILANKITAIMGRDEPKDVVDIWTIALDRKVNWQDIFTNVSSKAAGIFAPLIAERLSTFPPELLNKVNWIDDKKPSEKEFLKGIDKIVLDILKLKN